MNCPNCAAPMHFERERVCFSCEYCGSIAFVEPSDDGIVVLGEPTRYACPVCRRSLVLALVGRTEVSYCSNCRGMLVSQLAFFHTIRYLRARSKQPPLEPPPLDRGELKRQTRCPRCQEAMHTHPYGGPGNIVVDNCLRCHLIWLDHGEVARIIRAPEIKRTW